MYHRSRFLDLVGQTSSSPQGFEISRAEGAWLYDQSGVAYLDLISGFGVSNMGHAHPAIVEAIQVQSKLYLHTNVYGEHVQNPQNQLAALLRSILPSSLHQIYYLSTGSEVIDAAIKLARSYTGRVEIVALHHSYHGSTMAAESLRSDRAHSSHFLPLIPGVRFIHANNFEDLDKISERTALVLIEPIQAEAGVIAMEEKWLEGSSIKMQYTWSSFGF
ncbi:MAG: aminotransferase class III-fold pyridoxal phosphate-dependent enzyme [Saprospiraceae bacterium]|nr:aminotransferase class III-fold pyridoxal phosphate-dependent enzyme [Saprospiraceae bacterium]